MSNITIQAKEAIVRGKHPVTEDIAIQLASLQVQIHFGDHLVQKHKPGFLSNR